MKTRRLSSVVSMFIGAAMAGLSGACEAGGPAAPSMNVLPAATGVVFLTQEPLGPDDATMDALFAGRVEADAEGCIRLSTGHTVVWPSGYGLSEGANGLHVIDGSGRSAGVLGSTFRLGGGEVPSAEHLRIAPERRTVAESRCPGRYWVVAR